MSVFTCMMGAALSVASLFVTGHFGDELMHLAILLIGLGNIGVGIEHAIKSRIAA